MFKHISSGEKIIIAFALVTLPLVVLAVYAFSASAARGMIALESKNIETIASIQKNRLLSAVDVYMSAAQSIASDQALRTSIEKGSLSDMERVLRDLRASNGIVKSISILNTSGNVISSTNPGSVGLNYEDTAFFGSARSAPAVTSIGKDSQNQLEIELGAPIFSGSKVLAIIRVTAYADQILAITSDYSGLRTTGETLVVAATRAGEALFLTPKRFDSGGGVDRSVPSSQKDNPVFPALSGHEGFFGGPTTIDYRNKSVFASTRFLEDVRWGIVVKVDQEEVLGTVFKARKLLLGFATLFYGFVLIGWIVFIRRSRMFRNTQETNPVGIPVGPNTNTQQMGSPGGQSSEDRNKGDELSRLSQSLHTIATASKSLPESEKSDLDRLAVVLGAVASQYQQLASGNQVR